MKRINFFVTALFLCGINSAWGGCGLISSDGKHWKGLSTAGVGFTVNYVKWSGDNAGKGVYDVSLSVTMNQGVKYYYSSLDTSGYWIREDLPEGALDSKQNGCLEGNVVTATLQNVSVGGGTITPSVSSTNSIGNNSFQLLNNSANLTYVEQLMTPPGSYMVGISPTYYADSWNGKIYISTKGVSEGTYQVQVPVQISGVSVWFRNGDNYWDRVDGRQVAPAVQTINLPVSIRISSAGTPVNPDISCNFNKSAAISHGVLRKDTANGNSKIVPLQIRCNAATSASIKLTGDKSNANSVTVDLGRGISSALSVSSDRSTWYKQMEKKLANGSTTIYFRSLLQVENDSDVGKFNGAAVAVVSIN